MMSRAVRIALALLSTAATVHAQDAAPAPYVRSVEGADGRSVRLQTATRSFVRENSPTVHLVGVMHVGDQAYYDELQTFLNAQDLVLYEGVKPPGIGEPSKLATDDPSRVRMTEQRLRLVAVFAERFKREKGSYPESAEALIDAQPRPYARMLRGALVDAWGHAVQLSVGAVPAAEPNTPRRFDAASLGSDGQPGGDGPARDLRFSEQKPLRKSEVGGGGGLQAQLAEALGLKFQLAAIDYTRESWRNSDLSIDEVQARIKDSGADGETLFRLLDGSSFSAQLAGILLNFVKASPTMQSMVKLMMIEMLPKAEDMLSKGAAGVDSRLMKVIIVDRNQAVVDDLKKALRDEPGVKSIALFYGAGHLKEIETTLTKELGFAPETERWSTGIELDYAKSGMTPEQADQMRGMMRRQIEAQMNRPRLKPTPSTDRADEAEHATPEPK